MANIDSLVWLGYLTRVSEDISASRTPIYLWIATLERCCKAGCFEYNKAYILEFLFFGIKGGWFDFLEKANSSGTRCVGLFHFLKLDFS